MVQHQKTSLVITLFQLAALSMACSSGEVDLGEGLVSQDFTQPSRCAESAILSGDVHIASQSELETLAGCEEITGSLRIETFADADLSPLASLRVVGEALDLGADPIDVPEDPEAQQAFFEQYRALQEAGWLESLHGLEALESVQVLYLTAILVEDFTELESLERIAIGLVARRLPNLRNLAGLEGVSPPSLWISESEALESLDGFQPDDVMASVFLEDVPSLTNIDALEAVSVFDGSLLLSNTGLESLPALPELNFVAGLNIDNNLFLRDGNGLVGLTGATEMYFAANPVLEGLPAFSQLLGLDVLIVLNNDSIQELTFDFPALQPVFRGIQGRSIELSTALVEIGMNDALREISSPASFTAVQYFSVYQNPLLTDLDFGALVRVDSLEIADNAALESVTAPSLSTVDALQVTNNPALVPTAFDDVSTFTRQISGNAEPSAL